MKNDQINELQSGFTANRRGTDNLFMLKYSIEESFKSRKTLFVLSVDFQKAFDSIDRGKLIDTLMKFKIDPKVIDIIADIQIMSRMYTSMMKEKPKYLYLQELGKDAIAPPYSS